MCGIFGILNHKDNSIPNEHRLKETGHLLCHRGPDSEGIFADVGIGLVHTRLSLLDLSARSNQPFWDTQGRYCLVYNGEIYNFTELRAELETDGVQFKTSSDTEVLLEYLINRGIDKTLFKLEGMFAFALYDKFEKTLILARDRFGIKPLFIYDGDDAFIFASEIQALRPWLKFEPDLLSISSFLSGFQGPTKGHTFYKNIKFLSPGGVVKVGIGQPAKYGEFFSMVDFWDNDYIAQLGLLKPPQIVDKVEELLHESIKSQLIADAPVGALCSGGVDSSIIMAIAAKFHNNLAIFHANVVGPNSEFDAASLLAKHLKLDLKTTEVIDKDFIDMIPEITEHYGHPFFPNPHSVPFLKVSKLVRKNNVKAVLSGEGSDELFLGYRNLVPDIRKINRNPRKTLKELMNTLLKQKETENISTIHPLTLGMELHNRFEVGLENEEIRKHTKNCHGAALDFKNLKSIDLLNYNLRALLHRNDSMGMATSIESRFPFLDTKLVKLAVNMPYKFKIRFSRTAFGGNHNFFKNKWVLRKVAERYLPKKLSQRPKKNFPVDAFKRFKFSSSFWEKSYVVDLFGLAPREIQYLTEHAQQSMKIKLMHLDVWAHVCLNNLSKATIINRLRDHISITSY